MKSFAVSKSLKSITRGLVASAVLTTLAINAADTPASSRNAKGSGASKLSGNTEEATTSRDAESFLREAMEGNVAEVALAEVAEQKSQNPDVKQFAQMIRKDHQEANRQLQPIAQAHGVSMPQSLDSKHQKKRDHFQSLSGSEFDKEYATDMLKDHQKDISRYEKAAQELKETDVQQYAQATLPKLRQHLQHAVHTAQSVGVEQSAISAVLKKTPDAMGGVGETMEKSSDSGGTQY